MRTRIIAVVVAAVLAVVGAGVLVMAVRSADDRAAAGEQLVPVLVVTAAIPAGTSGDHLGGSVRVEKIPAAYVPRDAVADASDLAGLVAAVDLVAGEQVLAGRFQTPAELASSGARVSVPAGLQEVAVAVDLQRIAGGAVGPGDKVGVFVSFDPTSGEGSTTQLLLDQVLVTSVTSGVASSDEAVTQGLVLVSLALTAEQATAVVHAAEFGHIWMSSQNDDTAPGAAAAAVSTPAAGSIGVAP